MTKYAHLSYKILEAWPKAAAVVPGAQAFTTTPLSTTKGTAIAPTGAGATSSLPVQPAAPGKPKQVSVPLAKVTSSSRQMEATGKPVESPLPRLQ